MASVRPQLGLSTYLEFGVRNLWRNPRRTLLSLTSLVIATAVVTYLGAMNDGWLREMRNNFILTYTGHIQIHAPGHLDSRRIIDHIAEPEPMHKLLEEQPGIAAWTPRIEVPGLASVATASTGVLIVGINHETERQVTNLNRLLTTGHCLNDKSDRYLVLGQDIATTLDATPGTHVVLMGERLDGEIASEIFEVCGVIRSGAPQIDRVLALISLKKAQRWLGMGKGVTQLVIRAYEHGQVDGIVEDLRAGLPAGKAQVIGWSEIDPVVNQWLRFGEVYGLLVLGIVVALTITQVSNTMVMALYERIREFGLMEALGTRRIQLFMMVSWEALLLVSAGGSMGYLVGALAVIMSGNGIDLSAFSGALEFFFMDPVVYPVLTAEMGLKVFLSLAVAVVLGGIYPAWKAAQLEPVKAMR